MRELTVEGRRAALREIEKDARAHPTTDDDGVLRFVADPFARWLVDQGGVNLNEVWVAYARDAFPLRSVARFYRDIGYSLAGYDEVIGERLREERECL